MNLKVMVIDDSMIVRRQVAQALGAAGFDVCEAQDGQDALDHLAGSSVDLVFCDLNMPRMNGIDFLAAFRDVDVSSTPVVMLTTEAEPELVSRARSFGARGWIVKPFRPELLVAAARKLTSAAASQRMPRESAPSAVEAAPIRRTA